MAMREILFRGKGFRNEHWYYGNLYGNKCKIIQFFHNYSCKHAVIRDETIGQYTGLNDKNGVKIFEGDILSCDYYPYTSDGNQNYYAKVVWLDKNAAFGLYTFKNPTSKVRGVSEGYDYIDDFKSDEWEVIGNIYDSPELFEEGE